MIAFARRAFWVAAGIAAFGAARAGAQQDTPQFRSSVEVTSVDASVVDSDGHPIANLQPADFAVRIDGAARRVVSVQWISLATPAGAPPPPQPDGYSSNLNVTGGRLIIFAVDQPSIRFGTTVPLVRAIGQFLDRLEPSDRVAAVSLGYSGASTSFTADHELVRQAVARMGGEARNNEALMSHNISLNEAVEFERNDQATIDAVGRRECGTTGDDPCHQEVAGEARTLADAARQSANQTVMTLRSLLRGLASITEPKTMILISEGLPIIDQELDVTELGDEAARARTSVYVLQVDTQMDASTNRISTTRMGDMEIRSAGLDLLASSSRGTLLRVTNDGGPQFARIANELSGYYLIGLESEATDKDGKRHPIAVSVNRRGVTVHARRQLAAPIAPTAADLKPRDSVTSALISPLTFSSLPVRVATFSVREPETSKVQVLIHADIGAEYSSTTPVSLGYTVVDTKTGRQVESQVGDARLAPVMRGVPSALQFVSNLSVAPGDYTLKFAVADEDRVGTVEHHIHAGLVPAGPISLSELMVGGPVTSGDILRPTVGYTIAFGLVQGYLEAYAPSEDLPAVKFEIATSDQGEPLLSTDVAGVPGGRDRTIFSQTLPVRQLPPGTYKLRAVVSSHDETIKNLTRSFEVSPPAVLMTSAAVPSASTTQADIYLPVSDELLARKFDRGEAGRNETLRAFRATVAQASRNTFDEGARALSSGDYVKAEQSFKSAIRPDTDATAPMAYLAAVYAATGNDAQAAGAWQTALIEGEEFPQIYQWLGDTLLRTRDLAEARTILAEAAGKWPSDARFAKPLALVYAVFGQGREAVRTLQRHLEAHPDDAEALSLGVEWMFHLHSMGGVARSGVEDVKLARSWAAAYAKIKGPQLALVNEWMQALEKARP